MEQPSSSLDQERFTELESWEASLLDQQEQLDAATKAFRDEIAGETDRIQQMASEVAQRAAALDEREAQLVAREEKLRDQLKSFLTATEGSTSPIKTK